MRQKVVIVLIIMIASSVLRADNLTLSFSQNATDNLFQTRLAEKDHLSSLAFSFGKPFSPFSFFTEGEYYYLYRNTDISYYTQNLGLDYLHAFNERTAFYTAAKIGGNLYRSSFSDFNYFDLGIMAAIKSYLTPVSILKLDYSFDYKKYNYSSFDNRSHLATLSLDRYFLTKTTFKAGITWGYKQFIHPLSAITEADSRNLLCLGSGNGMGHGSRMGRRGGYFQTETSERGSGIQIFSLSGLVAQGVGDRIGLRLSIMRQWTLSGQNPFNSIEEYYLVENPTYDLYTWDGYVLSGLITVEVPANWQLKFGYTWSAKDFPGIEAMDLAESSLGVWRQDRRYLWEARLEKNFASFSIVLAYAYARNSSNDYLFSWQSHFLSLGLDWNLDWGSPK